MLTSRQIVLGRTLKAEVVGSNSVEAAERIQNLKANVNMFVTTEQWWESVDEEINTINRLHPAI